MKGSDTLDKYHVKVLKEEDPLAHHRHEPEPKENIFRRVRKNISVEPFTFLFVTATTLNMLISVNLNLEKACRVNLNFTDEICTALKNRQSEGLEKYETEVQKLTASLVSWKSIITALIPSILSIFVGSWTDRTGRRKIFILLVSIGMIMMTLSNIVNTYYFYELPLEVFVFSEAAFEALSGSWCISLLVAFSYVTAVTDLENRTFRIGLLNFWFSVGFPTGMAISGPLIKHCGYYVCYGIVGGLCLVNLIYNYFCLSDSEKTAEQKQHEGKGCRHLSGLFFDLSNLKETFTVVYKDLPRITILLINTSICYGTLFGEVSVTYLLTRYRYNWDEVKFGLFEAYNFVTHTFGVIISISLFSKYLKWHDAVLGLISASSKFCSSIVYSLAYNERIFFIAPLVEILNGTALIAIRSMLSKLVSPGDFGKVNSIFSLTENLSALVYVPLYTKVYTSTMEWFPGFLYLMTAGLMLPVLTIFGWMLQDHQKIERRIRKEQIECVNVDLMLKQ